MEFTDFLRTCTKDDGTPLSETSVQHYDSGLHVVSNDMLREKVISKPLEYMEPYELDLAIALIFQNNYFLAKDKKGKRMYSNALKRFRYFVLASNITDLAEEKEVQKLNNDITITERESIIKARIGQGDYRTRLLEKYNYSCIITQIRIPTVLIASHIKPWSVSTNIERLSVENGFIFSATYDRLFDRGLISFKDDGKMLISSMITNDDAQNLKLDKAKTYDIKFTSPMKNFLDYHRDVIFIK
jgi:predicted restriction endonuclease